MSLKKFFDPQKLNQLTKTFHDKAQSFFEPTEFTKPVTEHYAVIPPKQLHSFLNQAIRSTKITTLTLLKHNGRFETVSGKLYRIDNHLDAVYLQVSPKQKRLIFTKDIVHLGLDQVSSHDFFSTDQLISN